MTVKARMKRCQYSKFTGRELANGLRNVLVDRFVNINPGCFENLGRVFSATRGQHRTNARIRHKLGGFDAGTPALSRAGFFKKVYASFSSL
jgi:hypothetical protein